MLCGKVKRVSWGRGKGIVIYTDVVHTWPVDVHALLLHLQIPSIAVEEASEHTPSDEIGLVMPPIGEQTPSVGRACYVYVIHVCISTRPVLLPGSLPLVHMDDH